MILKEFKTTQRILIPSFIFALEVSLVLLSLQISSASNGNCLVDIGSGSSGICLIWWTTLFRRATFFYFHHTFIYFLYYPNLLHACGISGSVRRNVITIALIKHLILHGISCNLLPKLKYDCIQPLESFCEALHFNLVFHILYKTF